MCDMFFVLSLYIIFVKLLLLLFYIALYVIYILLIYNYYYIISSQGGLHDSDIIVLMEVSQP
jgi:hypothetical protein